MHTRKDDNRRRNPTFTYGRRHLSHLKERIFNSSSKDTLGLKKFEEDIYLFHLKEKAESFGTRTGVRARTYI